MKQNKLIRFSLLASLAVFAVGPVQGAVSAGSLVLFFQTRGVSGAGEGVYVNLGNAATQFRGATSGPNAAMQRVNFININATLVDAYGEGWASDPDIYAGVAGALSNSTSTTVTSGDQNRTLYASRPRNSVGTVGSSGTTAWDLVSAGNLTAGATSILGLLSNATILLPSADQGVVVDTAIRNANPINSGVQGTAFQQFTGGVQQRGSASSFGTFGAATSVEFMLDVQRLVPDGTVNTGEVAGASRTGSYEGTLTIDSLGNVSFITIPEPSSLTLAGIAGLALAFRRRRNA